MGKTNLQFYLVFARIEVFIQNEIYGIDLFFQFISSKCTIGNYYKVEIYRDDFIPITHIIQSFFIS